MRLEEVEEKIKYLEESLLFAFFSPFFIRLIGILGSREITLICRSRILSLLVFGEEPSANFSSISSGCLEIVLLGFSLSVALPFW